MSLTSRVTKCCSKPVMRISDREFPDGRTFFITTSHDACTGCLDEWPETLEQCDCCGDGFDHLIETNLGSWCKDCVTSYADELMEKVES